MKSLPKDAQVMSAILKDMGVLDYEPRLINQMLEFSYRKNNKTLPRTCGLLCNTRVKICVFWPSFRWGHNVGPREFQVRILWGRCNMK